MGVVVAVQGQAEPLHAFGRLLPAGRLGQCGSDGCEQVVCTGRLRIDGQRQAIIRHLGGEQGGGPLDVGEVTPQGRLPAKELERLFDQTA